MLGLIIYMIAALCCIVAAVLLSLIPKTAVKVVVLTLFLLLFIGGMTFVLFKVSGQPDIRSTFDALSLNGWAQMGS